MIRAPERGRLAWVLLVALAACTAPGTPPPPSPGPPAASAAGSVALVNAGFESREPGILGAPVGWFNLQHAGPHSYDFTLDATVARSGANSLRIDNVGPEVYGSVVQRIPAGAYRGSTLRYSVWMKTRGVKGGGLVGGTAPTLQAFRGGSPVASADGTAAMLTGNHEWTRREVTLLVPAQADSLEIGVVLGGPGSVWLDDAELVVVAGR